jgi:CheY-like chemotaxis protein
MVKRKVLLAEDDPDDQSIFTDFLKDRKDLLLLKPVENGEALMQWLVADGNHELPDLIILDQNMPKRNGLQTLQQLKEDDRYTNIPVVIYSTYTDQMLTKAALDLGAYKVAAKPVTRKGYNEMMNEFLEFFNEQI